MCLQNILRAGSVIHRRVNTKLWSNPQPRGRLDCDSSYLRLPSFFLHETSGRQQGEERLGAKVTVDKVVMWSWEEILIFTSLQNSPTVGASLLLGSHCYRHTWWLLRHCLCLDEHHRFQVLSALLHSPLWRWNLFSSLSLSGRFVYAAKIIEHWTVQCDHHHITNLAVINIKYTINF